MSSITALKNSEIVSKLLDFLHLSEKLKCTLRHDWTSTGRQESVADHSWRLALMVVLVAPHLEEAIDLEKALQMAIIHDLAEAITGDIPYFEAPEGSKARVQKRQNEKIVMNQIVELSMGLGFPLKELWEEYEEGASFEAKIVKGLDLLESQIQQLEAGVATWSENEEKDVFTDRVINKLARINDFLYLFGSKTLILSRLALGDFYERSKNKSR